MDAQTWDDLFDVHSDGEIDDKEMEELEDSLATPYKSLNWSSLRSAELSCLFLSSSFLRSLFASMRMT